MSVIIMNMIIITIIVSNIIIIISSSSSSSSIYSTISLAFEQCTLRNTKPRIPELKPVSS